MPKTCVLNNPCPNHIKVHLRVHPFPKVSIKQKHGKVHRFLNNHDVRHCVHPYPRACMKLPAFPRKFGNQVTSPPGSQETQKPGNQQANLLESTSLRYKESGKPAYRGNRGKEGPVCQATSTRTETRKPGRPANGLPETREISRACLPASRQGN